MSINIDDWPDVNEESLDADSKTVYLKRKKAVLMLIDGVKYSKIQDVTGIARNNLVRLIDRCEELDAFKVKYGFKGLIPYKRVKKYVKTSEKGYQGAFIKLLNDYPDLEKHIEKLFLGKRVEGVKFRELSITSIHKSFIAYCKKLNINSDEYPFCTKSKGRESLRKFCKNLSRSNFIQDTHNRVSVDNANDIRTFKQNTYIELVPKSKRPYSVVQIDGHSADVAFLLNTYNPCNEQSLVINRFWLLLAIDSASKKILGYSFSLNKNYRALDLIYCLINALTGQQLYAIHSDSNFEKSPKCRAFDLVTLDNHMSHRSPQLIDNVCKLTGATVRLNPGGRPRSNPVVERVFNTLKSKSTHLVPSSLGSKPSSPKRFKPDKFAKQNEITYEFITELINSSISEYNDNWHSSIASTPNDYIENYLKTNFLPFRTVNSEALFDLLSRKSKVTIRGKTSSQVRPPHINFHRAKYYATNMDLAACYYCERVTIVYNLLDLRIFKVFLKNGEELCDFVVEKKWNTRHSLYERKLINNLLNSEDVNLDHNDYVGSVIAHVKKVKKQRKDMLRKLKQGDVDRKQPINPIEIQDKEYESSFTYPKYNIFDDI